MPRGCTGYNEVMFGLPLLVSPLPRALLPLTGALLLGLPLPRVLLPLTGALLHGLPLLVPPLPRALPLSGLRPSWRPRIGEAGRGFMPRLWPPFQEAPPFSGEGPASHRRGSIAALRCGLWSVGMQAVE